MTSRDRAKEVANQARSTLLNVDREFKCKAIVAGLEPPNTPKDEDDFYTVSYHMAGLKPAWVMQTKLRKRYETLDTKVVAVQNKEWLAEVRVRVKREESPGEDSD